MKDRVKALPISQNTLAKMVGVTNSTLTKHLNNTRRMGLDKDLRMTRIIDEFEALGVRWGYRG